MLIIGCDYHPSFQQIAFVDTETGELGERRVVQPEEAKQFYSELKEQKLPMRVGDFTTIDERRQALDCGLTDHCHFDLKSRAKLG